MDTNEKIITEKVADIMKELGIEVTDNNRDTPKRVAKMYCRELFRNRSNDTTELDQTIKDFENPNGHNLIVVKDIRFSSTCEHHWLPFFGVCHIGYVPNDRVLGLSKLPRIVEWHSKKPQLQERLTNEIMEYIKKRVNPLYVAVKIEAKHTCVMCRGIESDCTTTTFSEWGARSVEEDMFNHNCFISEVGGRTYNG